MKVYEFRITGGSPYNGTLIINAKTLRTAKCLAQGWLDEYNKQPHVGKLTLTEDVKVSTLDTHSVIFFESGEA